MNDGSGTQETARVGTHVLIVDVDAAVRRQIMSWMAEEGYAVEAVGSFAEARRIIMSHARPDVLVTSTRLGPFNGLHLIITARTSIPAIRSVIVAPPHDGQVRRQAREFEAQVVAEPFTREALLDAVARALALEPRS